MTKIMERERPGFIFTNKLRSICRGSDKLSEKVFKTGKKLVGISNNKTHWVWFYIWATSLALALLIASFSFFECEE